MAKILIVEDDAHILTGLIDNIEMEGYETLVARDGREALKKYEEHRPDLVILDVMLPQLSGFEICKKLKNKEADVPIIILSAMGGEDNKVKGLTLGADDYVTKPFSPRELLMRIKAVLRRAQGKEKVADTLEFGSIRIDFKKYQTFKEEKEIKLTAVEYRLLKLLAANQGEPVSRHKILSDIRNETVTARTVDTHIWSLREKLETDPKHPQHILTVHRIGYKFI
jgi:DNA-binding response OmpR family regulator